MNSKTSHRGTTHSVMVLAVSSVLAALVPAALSAEDPAEQAQTAVAGFANALKSELTSAMQAGGPMNAIEVCNERAPAIAEALSLENGLNLSRVSLRNRNPDNAPNAWQTAVLQDFEERRANGEPPATLTWQEVANVNGQREFRFMRAIPTAPVCLACHGESIAQPVAEKIAELYPADQATGFREGDLRGAFVVTRAMKP